MGSLTRISVVLTFLLECINFGYLYLLCKSLKFYVCVDGRNRFFYLRNVGRIFGTFVIP